MLQRVPRAADTLSVQARATVRWARSRLRWLPKLWRRLRQRQWARKRAQVARRLHPGVPACRGVVTLALCRKDAERAGPVIRTVLRVGRHYRGAHDVEIRGFLDGTVTSPRNVATQYHVRMGCVGTRSTGKDYEVMRVLMRWDLRALPPAARIHSAALVLVQENTAAFPQIEPPRWPVDVYLYAVKKPWNPGRGGILRNNLSHPEEGDVWWLEAQAGGLPWREPGCGFAADGPGADREGSALASCRLTGFDDRLVLEGPAFARYVERMLAEEKQLSLLLKASDRDEMLPGSVRSFYSCEYGDDLTPARRPRLELEWSAPAVWSEELPFVLAPGEDLVLPVPAQHIAPETILCAAARIEESSEVPGVVPELSVCGSTPGGQGAAGWTRALELPMECPNDARAVHVSTAVSPVPAGESVTFRIRQTWVPSAPRVEDLRIAFTFTAPSGRRLDRAARYEGDAIYGCEFRPDELGAWTYTWRTTPDRRFPEHTGTGLFTVRCDAGAGAFAALEEFTESALAAVHDDASHTARYQQRLRLVALQQGIRQLRAAHPTLRSGALDLLLERIASVLAELW